MLLITTLTTVSMANAGGRHHGHDVGRVLGYTAAAALTVGAVGYFCCSQSNNYYNRGYNDRMRYEDARREQAAYDAEMARRNAYYYSAPPVVYQQVPVYTQPVYTQPVYTQPVYAQPVYQPVYQVPAVRVYQTQRIYQSYP